MFHVDRANRRKHAHRSQVPSGSDDERTGMPSSYRTPCPSDCAPFRQLDPAIQDVCCCVSRGWAIALEGRCSVMSVRGLDRHSIVVVLGREWSSRSSLPTLRLVALGTAFVVVEPVSVASVERWSHCFLQTPQVAAASRGKSLRRCRSAPRQSPCRNPKNLDIFAAS